MMITLHNRTGALSARQLQKRPQAIFSDTGANISDTGNTSDTGDNSVNNYNFLASDVTDTSTNILTSDRSLNSTSIAMHCEDASWRRGLEPYFLTLVPTANASDIGDTSDRSLNITSIVSQFVRTPADEEGLE